MKEALEQTTQELIKHLRSMTPEQQRRDNDRYIEDSSYVQDNALYTSNPDYL